MKGKLLVIVSLLIVLMLFTTACAMTSHDSFDMASEGRAPDISVEDSAGGDYDETTEESELEGGGIQPDKVISTVYLGFETEAFDEFSNELEELIRENQGYIEYSDIWYGGTSRAYRRGDYTIRLPQENLNKFKDNSKEIGNLINESTSREDVSSQYTDTESRLRIVETKEERILDLLENADLMADIIELERELSNIVYEKEYLTSQLMGLDDKIDYSTVNLSVEEVERYTSTDDLDTGLGTRLKHALEDSFHFFVNAMETLVISFVYFLPFLIVIVIVAFIAKKVYDKYRKKN